MLEANVKRHCEEYRRKVRREKGRYVPSVDDFAEWLKERSEERRFYSGVSDIVGRVRSDTGFLDKELELRITGRKGGRKFTINVKFPESFKSGRPGMVVQYQDISLKDLDDVLAGYTWVLSPSVEENIIKFRLLGIHDRNYKYDGRFPSIARPEEWCDFEVYERFGDSRNELEQVVFEDDDRLQASLSDFLVSLFGEGLDLGRMGEYLAARGDVVGFRALAGGFSSRAVVALEDRVVKLDSSRKTAELQRRFFSQELGALAAYAPRALSEGVVGVGDVYAWDMTSVSCLGENRFERSRRERSRIQEISGQVRGVLSREQFAEAGLSAVMQGARSLCDFIDHHVYVLALFHEQASNMSLGVLPVGPESYEKRMEKLLTVKGRNKGAYAGFSELLGDACVKEVTQKLSGAVSVLRESASAVIFGDYKVDNCARGAVFDPTLRYGSEAEDIAKFLESERLALPSEVKKYFVRRYLAHRSRMNPDFAESGGRQEQIVEVYPVAAYHEKVREFSAMQNRPLYVPRMREEMAGLAGRARELAKGFG